MPMYEIEATITREYTFLIEAEDEDDANEYFERGTNTIEEMVDEAATDNLGEIYISPAKLIES